MRENGSLNLQESVYPLPFFGFDSGGFNFVHNLWIYNINQMDRDNREAKRKMLRRRGLRIPGDTGTPALPPMDTVISADSSEILATEFTLKGVANILSNSYLGRKITGSEAKSLWNFLSKVMPAKYYGLTYERAIRDIAKDFHYFMKNPGELQLGVNRKIPTSVKSWQMKEIGQLTDDEHPYKYNTFYDEVGETDHIEEVRKDLETPGYSIDGETIAHYPSAAGSGGASHGDLLHGIAQLVKSISSTNDLFRSNLSPSHISKIIRDSWSNRVGFDNISLRELYIPFDSRFRDTSTEVPPLDNPIPCMDAKLSFKIHHSTEVGAVGDIRVQSELKEILAIRTGEILLPWCDDIDIFYDRITLFIEEISEQSAYTADPQIRFHFMYSAEKIDHTGCPGTFRIKLTPIPPYDRFITRYPVARLERATLTFRNPYDLVQIPLDQIRFNVSAASPAVFSTVTGDPHGIPDDSLVYIQGFVNDDGTDNIIAARSKGHRIDLGAADEFTIDATGNNDVTLSSADTQTVTAFIGCARFMIPLFFKTLE